MCQVCSTLIENVDLVMLPVCLYICQSFIQKKVTTFSPIKSKNLPCAQEVIAEERDLLKQSLELLTQDMERLKQENEALMKDKDALLRDVEDWKDAEEFQKLEEESKKEYEVFLVFFFCFVFLNLSQLLLRNVCILMQLLNPVVFMASCF